MDALIPYAAHTIAAQTQLTVNGRDLHAFLGIKRHYTDWIRDALRHGQFVLNVDYLVFHAPVKNPQGGRPPKEYVLTFKTGKHIAMMSGSAKGPEVRDYFLLCEERARGDPEVQARRDTTFTQRLASPPLPGGRDMLPVPHPDISWDALEHHGLAVAALASKNRDLAEEVQVARTESRETKALASQALNGQERCTIAEFVFRERLEQKFPRHLWRACSDFLAQYCLDNNITVREVRVNGLPWHYERGFPIEVLTALVPGWLCRHYAQPPLRVVPLRQGET